MASRKLQGGGGGERHRLRGKGSSAVFLDSERGIGDLKTESELLMLLFVSKDILFQAERRYRRPLLSQLCCCFLIVFTVFSIVFAFIVVFIDVFFYSSLIFSPLSVFLLFSSLLTKLRFVSRV